MSFAFCILLAFIVVGMLFNWKIILELLGEFIPVAIIVLVLASIFYGIGLLWEK